MKQTCKSVRSLVDDRKKSDFDGLYEEVISKGYCIGCGLCASYPEAKVTMGLNDNGLFEPIRNFDRYENYKYNGSFCPFSSLSDNEDQISKRLFHNVKGIYQSQYSGYYLKEYIGHVTKGEFRKNGSSGGMVTWFADLLLKEKFIDAFIHVKPSSKGGLFSYQISSSSEEIISGSQSRYYPIEMSEVVEYVRIHPGKYAIVGIPCFIKSIRLICETEPVLRDRIIYAVGLVCGHLKSAFFSDSIGWEMGIKPGDLESISHRVKIDNRNASQYSCSAKGIINGKFSEVTQSANSLFVTNWGLGMFMYKACNYCDDVTAETADVTFGDAWLQEYDKDSKGNNIIIFRNPKLLELFEDHMSELSIESTSDQSIFDSQAGGFRHRREGLAYRLHICEKKGIDYPIKRVTPSENLSRRRKKIYIKRMALSEKSFISYKKALEFGDFGTFKSELKKDILEYNRLIKPSLLMRLVRKSSKIILKLLNLSKSHNN